MINIVGDGAIELPVVGVSPGIIPAAAKADPNQPDPAAGRLPDIINGLSKRVKAIIVVFSLLLAAVSIGFSWYMVCFSRSISIGTTEELKGISSVVQQTAGNDSGPSLRCTLLVHLADTQAHLHSIANRQELALLSLGLGVTLIAMGFSLFLINADGAFKLYGQGKGSAGVAVQSTAPGLLCFVLATILIGLGITRTQNFEIGAFFPDGSSPSPSVTGDATPSTTESSHESPIGEWSETKKTILLGKGVD